MTQIDHLLTRSTISGGEGSRPGMEKSATRYLPTMSSGLESDTRHYDVYREKLLSRPLRRDRTGRHGLPLRGEVAAAAVR